MSRWSGRAIPVPRASDPAQQTALQQRAVITAFLDEIQVDDAAISAAAALLAQEAPDAPDLRERATFAAKAAQLLRTVAADAGLDPGEAGVDARLAALAEARGAPAEPFAARFGPADRALLRRRLAEEAALDWLLRNNRFVASPAAPASPERTAALRPTLKPRAFVDAFRAQTGRLPVWIPLPGDLVVALAFDRGDALQLLTEDDAAAFAGEDLLAIAYGNLLASPELTPKLHGPGPHVMITAGGTYEAALLLVPEVCDAAAARLRGDLVACVPARDLLLFGGTEDPASIAEMRRIAADVFARTTEHLLSQTLFVRRGRRWGVFEAPETH